MRRIEFGIRVALVGLAFLVPREARAQAPFDVAIVGGRVIDPETGLDGIRNVGVRGDIIAAVTEAEIQASVVLDARGLVVAPGFIDNDEHRAAGTDTRREDDVSDQTPTRRLEGGAGGALVQEPHAARHREQPTPAGAGAASRDEVPRDPLRSR